MPALIKYAALKHCAVQIRLVGLQLYKNNKIFWLSMLFFVNELFLLAPSSSEALQFADTDLRIAATAVEDLSIKLLLIWGTLTYERIYWTAMDHCCK